MQSDPFMENVKAHVHQLFADLWAQVLAHPFWALAFLVGLLLVSSGVRKIRYGETFQRPDIYRTGTIHGVLGIFVLLVATLGSGMIPLEPILWWFQRSA